MLNLLIGVKGRTDFLTVIWSVFHEWGHLIQPTQTDQIRLDPVLTYQRESDAWNKAGAKLYQFDQLLPYMSHFYAYRDVCLLDYANKIAS